MVGRLTTEQFVSKAQAIHGDKYNYDEVVYITTFDEVKVYCNYHKEFFTIAPTDHISHKHRGCPKCGMDRTMASLNKMAKAKKLSTEEFIKRSKVVHGDKYDYSKSEYLGDGEKVEIICPKHGPFSQCAGAHSHGHGCQECYDERRAISIKKDSNQFIEECKIVHNNKYTYENTIYTASRNKIEINCPIHGAFPMIASDHLRGCGCYSCYKEEAFKETLNERTKSFIDKSTKMHNGKYDYSNSKYMRRHDEVEIICPIHNSFWQIAGDHMMGSGCPRCAHFISTPEVEWLNSLNIPDDKHHRNCLLKINGKRFYPDGFDPETNTIYEFNGDYYHGNPAIYDQNKINPTNYSTFGELYAKTLAKEQMLKDAGYNVISIWESDYKASLK